MGHFYLLLNSTQYSPAIAPSAGLPPLPRQVFEEVARFTKLQRGRKTAGGKRELARVLGRLMQKYTLRKGCRQHKWLIFQ
jgi:hypothetical protein